MGGVLGSNAGKCCVLGEFSMIALIIDIVAALLSVQGLSQLVHDACLFWEMSNVGNWVSGVVRCLHGQITCISV